MTPTQFKIITLLGAKHHQAKNNKKLGNWWMAEALELLLMLEIERVAAKDNVDLNGLLEAVIDAGSKEFDELLKVEEASGATH
jgi:hypothetical protein